MSASRTDPQSQTEIQQMLPPAPEVIVQIVDNQTKELEIRQKEIAIAEQNNERQFNYASKQLEAQERDRKDERNHRAKQFNHGLCAAVVVVVVVCVFFGFCISQGESEIVTELFKLLCYGGSFGTGGFAWGRYARRSDSEKK